MPKKQDNQEEPTDSVLVTAAKTIGKAAGKIVSAVSGGKSNEKPPARKGKKVKRNKTRLPRKAKKEAKKARLGKA
jgi:hypothetical protein